MYDMLREAQLCCRIMSNDRCTSNEKTCSPCMSQLVRHTVISNNILSKMPAKYRVRTTFDVAECHQEVDHGVMDGFWFWSQNEKQRKILWDSFSIGTIESKSKAVQGASVRDK